MGDNHFLLQNTLTGLVFLSFVLASFGVIDQKTAFELLKFLFTNWQILIAIAFSPILGIFVQGCYMFFIYVLLKKHPYYEEGRQLFASRIRDRVDNHSKLPPDIKNKFISMPDDSLFVLLFYTNATDKLVEWVRRRHDFQHLGENWLTSAILGSLSGLIVGSITLFEIYKVSFFLPIILLITLFIWILGLMLLRKKMKQDAEALVSAWVYGQLYPEIIKDLEINEKIVIK